MSSNLPPSAKQSAHDLKGRVALVTGASRGIGKAIALRLAGCGADVAICARSAQALEQVSLAIAESGVRCLAAVCDVTSEAEVEAFLQSVDAAFSHVDILVNNAGVYATQAVALHPLQTWETILRTNLTSALLFCRAVVAGMSERRFGRIVNIASVSARTGEIWGSAYSSSKFGMIGLTQSLALEVASKGITVNAVCPGWVSTEMMGEQLKDDEWCKLNETTPEQSLQNACFAVPQNRFIEPEEVAGLVAYLCSDDARGITGQAINICGGLCLQ